MEKMKAALTGFILGDWLGLPYVGKGKGTFKPIWIKSYLRGDKCSGNTAMLLCTLDSHGEVKKYQQNLKDWYAREKYVNSSLDVDIDPITRKAIQKNFRAISSDANSGNRSLAVCCVLALSSLSEREVWEFVKATHNSRYSYRYTIFFVEFVRGLLRMGDKEAALAQAQQKCELQINRQNFSNGTFVVDTVESVINCFMAGEDYATCVFPAVNAGKASDAVGALTGFLAGLQYGVTVRHAIRDFQWMEQLIDVFLAELEATNRRYVSL